MAMSWPRDPAALLPWAEVIISATIFTPPTINSSTPATRPAFHPPPYPQHCISGALPFRAEQLSLPHQLHSASQPPSSLMMRKRDDAYRKGSWNWFWAANTTHTGRYLPVHGWGWAQGQKPCPGRSDAPVSLLNTEISSHFMAQPKLTCEPCIPNSWPKMEAEGFQSLDPSPELQLWSPYFTGTFALLMSISF